MACLLITFYIHCSADLWLVVLSYTVTDKELLWLASFETVNAASIILHYVTDEMPAEQPEKN